MITRRDFIVAGVCIFTTAAVIALAQTTSKPILHSSVFNWKDFKAETTKTGERREVFDSPTATLTRMEMHITTLNPGEAPHLPHHHPEEELMILKEGTVQEVQNGVTNRVEAGGVIFCASEEIHGMLNIGTNRATYYVLKIYPHDLPKPKPE
jgi:uncharacterized cupin superfamily protein